MESRKQQTLCQLLRDRILQARMICASAYHGWWWRLIIGLLVISGLAWLYSLRVGVHASYYRPGAIYMSFSSAGGVFYLGILPKPQRLANPPGWHAEYCGTTANSKYHERSGYLPFLVNVMPYGGPGFSLFIPYWLTIVTETLIGACLPAWMLHRRVREGLCVRCGYNLTGNVSGVCPECGVQVPDGSTKTR